MTLLTALAELGLIDGYQLVVHTHVAGRGPLAGLSRPLDLALVDRFRVTPGVVAFLSVVVLDRHIEGSPSTSHRAGAHGTVS